MALREGLLLIDRSTGSASIGRARVTDRLSVAVSVVHFVPVLSCLSRTRFDWADGEPIRLLSVTSWPITAHIEKNGRVHGGNGYGLSASTRSPDYGSDFRPHRSCRVYRSRLPTGSVYSYVIDSYRPVGARRRRRSPSRFRVTPSGLLLDVPPPDGSDQGSTGDTWRDASVELGTTRNAPGSQSRTNGRLYRVGRSRNTVFTRDASMHSPPRFGPTIVTGLLRNRKTSSDHTTEQPYRTSLRGKEAVF